MLETSEEVRLQLVDLVADHLLPKCAHVPTASTAQDIATVSRHHHILIFDGPFTCCGAKGPSHVQVPS